MIVSYKGKERVKCEMCHQMSSDKYLATPDIPGLVDWDIINLCKKCAKRETGSKNKKRWEQMHELAANV